ncbi:alpha/beta hydrolase family esterase [Formosa haliotis]|uniref:alpha/beta hydrolase family esterase n=1 Tax=Formosa haliotis TaxID=1555194 RepID=UPI000824DC1E|nr:PHB depolymerase family esterase [Formosa haliotis]
MVNHQLKFKVLFTFAAIVLCLFSCKNHISKGTFIHNNLERTYIIYTPSNLPKNAPLVFVLHSYGRFANDHMQSLQLDSIAEINKFMVCYPQGTLDVNTGKPYWTGGLATTKIDDIGYLTDLAKHLQTKHNLDPNRTFSCGISNGGFMSYTLACKSPNVFKAIASVEGTMTGQLWKNRNLTTQPIPVLQISGTLDTIVPIDGSMSTAYGWGGAPHMDTIMNYWSKFNACKQIDTLSISPKIQAYHYKKGIHNNEVWYYKLQHFGHDLPTKENSGLDANVLIWDFFSRY